MKEKRKMRDLCGERVKERESGDRERDKERERERVSE